MKTYEEAMAWVQSVVDLPKQLPPGVAMISSTQGHNNRYTLKEVLPEAIKRVAEEYDVSVAGDVDGAYCYVDFTHPKLPTKEELQNAKSGLIPFALFHVRKRSQKHFRFFYRKTSGRDRSETKEYLS